MPVIEIDTHARRWEAEELEAVCGPKYRGDLATLAEQLGRCLRSIEAKRSEFNKARRTRQACGAFLSDDGLPYRVVMARIWRQAS